MVRIYSCAEIKMIFYPSRAVDFGVRGHLYSSCRNKSDMTKRMRLGGLLDQVEQGRLVDPREDRLGGLQRQQIRLKLRHRAGDVGAFKIAALFLQ